VREGVEFVAIVFQQLAGVGLDVLEQLPGLGLDGRGVLLKPSSRQPGWRLPGFAG